MYPFTARENLFIIKSVVHTVYSLVDYVLLRALTAHTGILYQMTIATLFKIYTNFSKGDEWLLAKQGDGWLSL
jgi:hypothetical protein